MFSNHSEIVLKNKNKPFHQWLKFNKLFKTGKQGITGLVHDKNENKFAFKISQHVNYLAEHEFNIMSRLNSMSMFCPHFCKAYDLIPVIVEPKPQKDSNPFEVKSKYPIQQNLLLEEFIEGSKLCNHIKSEKTNMNVLFSAIKQSLNGINIAQRKCNFTHYDLHSDNIILRKCDYDTVYMYLIDEETAFAVPTFGYSANIIDFGFSYVESPNNESLLCTLAHTDVGFMSDRFDALADAKVLLISMNEELKTYRKSKGNAKEIIKFNNIVHNIFANLSVHWDCGWDDNDNEGASYILLDKVQKKSENNSRLFKKYGDFCFDIILTLIKLPLSESNTKELQLSYEIFVKEFLKIEDEIKSSVYNLYILKNIVDTAKAVESLYVEEETRDQAINKFRLNVIDSIHKVSKYCSPKKIHYERMLCSLYSLAECSNGYLYKIINNQMGAKLEEYNNLPLDSIEEIINILNVNFEDDYQYNAKTNVVVFNIEKETRDEFKLTKEQIKVLNDFPSYMRSNILAQMYTQNENDENGSNYNENENENENENKESGNEEENDAQEDEESQYTDEEDEDTLEISDAELLDD